MQSLASDHQMLFLEVGRTHIDKLFNWNREVIVDDSEFIPLIDMLIKTFQEFGLTLDAIRDLRTHATQRYHEACIEAEPTSTFAENKKLMLGYLPPKRRIPWEQPKEGT